MLYIDQRGTGLSTPIDADVWMEGCTVAEKVQRLKMMRADNIGTVLHFVVGLADGK